MLIAMMAMTSLSETGKLRSLPICIIHPNPHLGTAPTIQNIIPFQLNCMHASYRECTGFSVTTAHHILPSLSSFYSDMSAYDTGVVLITWSASFFYTSTHCKVKTTSPPQLLLVLLVSVQGSNCIVRLCLGRHKLISTHRSWYPR